jgi:hypothetical protein
MWPTYTMEYYLAKKKNEILSFTAKQMELEDIVLSEVSQRHIKTGIISSHIWKLKKADLNIK